MNHAPADLLGRQLRDLRISVTDRCNLRCSYCMPREIFGPDHVFLPKPLILSYEEITRLAGIFVALGTQKLRITGGEPLLRKDLHCLVQALAKNHPESDLALTTNGILLQKEAAQLHRAGLRRITVSLDALSPDVFRKISDSPHHPDVVIRGIESATTVGFRPVKINVVVRKHLNEKEILPLALRFNNPNHHVRFIEYMDVGNTNGWRMADVVSADEILQILAPLELSPIPPAYPGEVASHYQTQAGSIIGVIPSVTRPFCATCTRARLTSDGRLFTCLFANEGLNLRDTLRAGASDADISQMIRSTWAQRTDRYSELRANHAAPRTKPEMSFIGG